MSNITHAASKATKFSQTAAKEKQEGTERPYQDERGVLQYAWDGVMSVWLGFRTGSRANDAGACLFINAAVAAACTSDVHSAVARRDELPPKPPGALRFVVVSDTHSRHAALGKLPAGDVFVHSGDILMSSRFWSPGGNVERYRAFNAWLATVPCPIKVVIGGNHDRELETMGPAASTALLSNAVYLENSAVEVVAPSGQPVVLYGSPTSNGRSGNSAFQSAGVAAAALQGASALAAPLKAVVLVTHGPAEDLQQACGAGLKAHLWGHAHAAHGVRRGSNSGVHNFLSVCASVMDTSYCPTNLPVVFDYAL